MVLGGIGSTGHSYYGTGSVGVQDVFQPFAADSEGPMPSGTTAT